MIEIPGIPGFFLGDVHLLPPDEEKLHEKGAGPDCPCRPRLDYQHPKTGQCVWIHRAKGEWS